MLSHADFPSLFPSFRLQVYQAKWHQTLVAVKILMNTGVNPDDKEAMQQLALTLSSPLLNNLQKVRV